MTRSEMAAFIRKVAENSFDESEWSVVMVNHYEDIEIEHARAQTVRVRLDKSGIPDDATKRFLLGIASGLVQHSNGLEFYFQGRAVGVFSELPPIEGACEVEIEYEPFRGAGHYEMQAALRNGESPRCEYMRGGRKVGFTVIGSPSNRRLKVRL